MRAKERRQPRNKKSTVQPWIAAKEKAEKLHILAMERLQANNQKDHKKYSLYDLQSTFEDLQEVLKKLLDETQFLAANETNKTEISKIMFRSGQVYIVANINLDLIDMCRILHDRHCYLALQNKAIWNYTQAIRYLEEMAITYIKQYNEYKKLSKLNFHVLIQDYTEEKEIVLQIAKTKKSLAILQPIIDSDTELQALRKQAKCAEDPEKKAGLYKKAMDLALSQNDFLAQFEMLHEQLKYYKDNTATPADNSELYQIYAAKIARYMKNITALLDKDESLKTKIEFDPDALYVLALNLSMLVDHRLLNKNVEQKISFLTDSYNYLTASMDLAKIINYNQNKEKVTELHDKIIKQIMLLELKLNAIKEEKLALERQEKSQKKYIENFPKLLKNFPDTEQKKIQKHVEEIIWNDDDLSVSENDEPAKVIIPAPVLLTPEEMRQLLIVAEQKNDPGEQIYLHTCLGENYKRNAEKYFRHHDYKDCIDQLQIAIAHFTAAYQLIKENKSSNQKNEQKEYSLTLLLESTERFFKITIKKQEDIRCRFEASRLEVMEIMGDKWYQNNTGFLSLKAQILMNAKYNITILTEMHQSFEATFSDKIGKRASTGLDEHSIFRPKVDNPKVDNPPVVRESRTYS